MHTPSFCCIILLMIRKQKAKFIKKEKIMSGKITKEMNILEIVQNYPESLAVFQKYGLG